MGAGMTFLCEEAPTPILGQTGSIIALGCNVGFFLSSLVGYLLTSFLSTEQMLRWGWRVPFIGVLLPGLLILQGVHALDETAEFKHMKEEGNNPAPVSSFECMSQVLLPAGPGRDALEGKGPQRPQRRLGRRLEEVAVQGGYCRLQMPLKLAPGVRGTVAGHRLGTWEGGGGGSS